MTRRRILLTRARPAPAVPSPANEAMTAWHIGLESVYPKQVIVAERHKPPQHRCGSGISVLRDVPPSHPGLTPGIRTPEEHR